MCHHGRCQLTGKEDGVKKMAISNFFFFSMIIVITGAPELSLTMQECVSISSR